MDTTINETYVSTESASATGVAWPAIIGGAFAAAGLTLVLSPLGAAMGFAWTSPWNSEGFGKAITIMGAVWLIIVQWLSSGFGGYLTGRLRRKWPATVHTHEVFFRDTVHGFLSWALASVMGAILLMSVLSPMATTAAQNDTSSSPYVSSSLFRTATSGGKSALTYATATDQDRSEAHRIIAMGVMNGQIPIDERNYLAQLVVSRTGASMVEAETRIDNAVTQEKMGIENMAKASFFACLSLMIGAFIAAAAGALGVHYTATLH